MRTIAVRIVERGIGRACTRQIRGVAHRYMQQRGIAEVRTHGDCARDVNKDVAAFVSAPG